jgi:hypothetical protein
MIRKQKNSCHCIIIISEDLKAQLENGRNTKHTQLQLAQKFVSTVSDAKKC